MLSDYLKAVEAMIRRKFAEGHPEEIRFEIRRLARRYDVKKSGLQLAEKLLKFVESELKESYISRFTREFTVEKLEDLTDKFDVSVLRAVQRAMRTGDRDEVLKDIKRIAGSADNHLRTIEQTLRGGISQAQKFADAGSDGNSQWKYVGPSGNTRPFCRMNLGKIRTLDEWRAMNNGQGLPVPEFCGGWRCRHNLILVQ